MPKPVINAIIRSEENYTRQNATQMTPFFSDKTRQTNFLIETEFQHAKIAAKQQRLFSKPFVCAFGEFEDHVSQLCTSTTNPNIIFSASYDGTIKVANYRQGEILNSIKAHRGAVTGLQNNANLILSSGHDGMIKYFNFINNEVKLVHEINNKDSIFSISLSSDRHFGVIDSQGVQLYDITRYSPYRTFNDVSGSHICFNPTSPNLFAVISDITFKLYDVRVESEVMSFQTIAHLNKAAFNAFHPSLVFLATDDSYCYSFDIRATSSALDRYGGYPYPITSLDISPDGRKLVLGSNGGTVQIYDVSTVSRKGQTIQDTLSKRVNTTMEEVRKLPYRQSVRALDMYHNKRMGQINAITFSTDGYYILTGSSEGNVRVWKAQAHQVEKQTSHRQAQAIATNKRLVQKFQNTGEIKDILYSRYDPKKIRNIRARIRAHDQAELKRLEQRGEKPRLLQKQVRRKSE